MRFHRPALMNTHVDQVNQWAFFHVGCCDTHAATLMLRHCWMLLNCICILCIHCIFCCTVRQDDDDEEDEPEEAEIDEDQDEHEEGEQEGEHEEGEHEDEHEKDEQENLQSVPAAIHGAKGPVYLSTCKGPGESLGIMYMRIAIDAYRPLCCMLQHHMR